MKNLIATLLIGMLGIGLLGCGAASPEKVVENYFSDIKNVKINVDAMTDEEKEAFEYLQENFKDELKNVEKKAKEIIKDVDVEVLSSEEKDDIATVKVKIKAVDASEFFVKFISELFTQGFSEILSNTMNGTEEINNEKMYGLTIKILDENLSDAEFESVDREFTIKLEKVDDAWQFVNKEALSFEIMNIDSSKYENFKSKLGELK